MIRNSFHKILYQNNLAVKKASQSFVRMDEIKCNPFFAPTCAKRKIHIVLQVWNLAAYSRQIMRAAKLLSPLRTQGHLKRNAPQE